MKFFSIKKPVLSIFLVFVFPAFAAAQQYQLDPENSFIIINGSSTLHDWNSEVKGISGYAKILSGDSRISRINELSITVSVKSIKSGKNGMDKNAYEALKEDQFPLITYNLTNLKDITENQILASGLLTIAGISREVNMNVNYRLEESGMIELKGSLDLKMTDFEIEPPTALLGTVKTSNDVALEYEIVWRK